MFVLKERWANTRNIQDLLHKEPMRGKFPRFTPVPDDTDAINREEKQASVLIVRLWKDLYPWSYSSQQDRTLDNSWLRLHVQLRA